MKQKEISVLDVNILNDFTSALKACKILDKQYPVNTTGTGIEPGINVLLRYSVAESVTDKPKSIFPFTQELFIGLLCCDFHIIPLFPFHKCKEWNSNELPTGF